MCVKVKDDFIFVVCKVNLCSHQIIIMELLSVSAYSAARFFLIIDSWLIFIMICASVYNTTACITLQFEPFFVVLCELVWFFLFYIHKRCFLRVVSLEACQSFCIGGHVLFCGIVLFVCSCKCVFVHSVYTLSWVLLSGFGGDTEFVILLWHRRSPAPVSNRDPYGNASLSSSSNSGSCKGSDGSPTHRWGTTHPEIKDAMLFFKRLLSCLFIYCIVFLYTTFLIYIRRHMKYTACNDNHGIRPPPPEQYLTPLQQKEVCIRHLRARLKETIDRLQDR